MPGMEPGIPAPLAGLIYAALGSLGADLAEEQHPSAAMVATVVEIFENGVSEQVGQKVLAEVCVAGLKQVKSILDADEFLRGPGSA